MPRRRVHVLAGRGENVNQADELIRHRPAGQLWRTKRKRRQDRKFRGRGLDYPGQADVAIVGLRRGGTAVRPDEHLARLGDHFPEVLAASGEQLARRRHVGGTVKAAVVFRPRPIITERRRPGRTTYPVGKGIAV